MGLTGFDWCPSGKTLGRTEQSYKRSKLLTANDNTVVTAGDGSLFGQVLAPSLAEGLFGKVIVLA